MKLLEVAEVGVAVGVHAPGGGVGGRAAVLLPGVHLPGGGSGAPRAPILNEVEVVELVEEVEGVHDPGGGRGIKTVVRLGGELVQVTFLVGTSFLITVFISTGPVADGVNGEVGALAVGSDIKTVAPDAVEAVEGGGEVEEGTSDSSGPVPLDSGPPARGCCP